MPNLIFFKLLLSHFTDLQKAATLAFKSSVDAAESCITI